jgi:hypothetical protein
MMAAPSAVRMQVKPGVVLMKSLLLSPATFALGLTPNIALRD